VLGYVALIRPHVIHEEKRLFAIADRLLAPELQETIQAEYDSVEAEVASAGLHDAFEETVERLRSRYLPPRPN